VNIWQSYKQERGCLVHFLRPAAKSIAPMHSPPSTPDRDAHVSGGGLVGSLVVGELEFLERDDGAGCQLVGCERRVRVVVEARDRRRVGLAGHDPRRPVIRVPALRSSDRQL